MSVQLFDKKLAELDAYLQMLIAESEGLDCKISDADKESERDGLLLIKQNLEKLLSSIKHSIVVLQIAKVSFRTDDESITNLSRNPKLSYKQRLISGRHQQSPTAIGAGKHKSRSSQQQSESESSRCGSICETSNSTGTESDQVAQINSTTSPQPPARLSKRRSQQQPTKARQDSPASNSSNITENNNPQRFLQQRFKSSSSGGSSSIESTSLAGAAAAEPSRSSIASTSEANKAQYQYRGTNDPNVNNINESSTSSSAFVHVEHDVDEQLNAHNGSRATDDRSLITGKSVKTHAELEHGDEDEDDDAFFDAADDQQQHNNYNAEQHRQRLDYHDQELTQSQKINTRKDSLDNDIVEQSKFIDNSEQNQNVNSTSNMSNSRRADLSNHNNNNIIPDEAIDWDLLYEEEDEEDLGSLEGQGSVIKHLLSQIRIGMDLTKVVLPTFILERRSLLEMYADFFAHPDLFSSIPDYETPEERMIQVVRWYLSAFHAGRKSSVAKKPYNPILGEIFLCHWKFGNKGDISPQGDKVSNNNKNTSYEESSNQVESTTTTTTTATNSSSDIEQFTKSLPENSLLFVAEQVSHHPPVSAFYAENRKKRITCCAHIYTKSKYLGLSVGVHNIGQGEINLLKHNETYVCTFPSAYGRSILTVPWVELGGSVNITCEQTGYSAKLEFVTKPFYGGKKHRVIGEILRPNNEPFLSIDGEWNGCMYSKSPPNSSEKEVFVDTTRLPVIKKIVRPVSTQESFESRNVWKEVTRALKLRDVTTATAAKSYIEQRQRDLLKDRTEKGQKWKTRYFEANDNGWAYSKSLSID